MAAAKEADMDALVNALAGDIGVGCEANEEMSDEHPHYSQYKNYGTLAERQRERRRDWMDKQRE